LTGGTIHERVSVDSGNQKPHVGPWENANGTRRKKTKTEKKAGGRRANLQQLVNKTQGDQKHGIRKRGGGVQRVRMGNVAVKRGSEADKRNVMRLQKAAGGAHVRNGGLE